MKAYTTTSSCGLAISPSSYSLTAPASSAPIRLPSNPHISMAQSPKTTYYILGEHIEVAGQRDAETCITIATINILGKSFYDELKKNGISFCAEIEEFLKVRFRDHKIESVLSS